MALFDFKCNQCGELSEMLVRSPADHSVRCPVCGSDEMEKLISAPRIVRMKAPAPGTTCCGRTERCQSPPCSTDDLCRRA